MGSLVSEETVLLYGCRSEAQTFGANQADNDQISTVKS